MIKKYHPNFIYFKCSGKSIDREISSIFMMHFIPQSIYDKVLYYKRIHWSASDSSGVLATMNHSYGRKELKYISFIFIDAPLCRMRKS